MSVQLVNTGVKFPDGTIQTTQAPAKTGAGATGTWPIGITGNSATATKLATARTINGLAFDGTANITIPTSSLPTSPSGKTWVDLPTNSLALASDGTVYYTNYNGSNVGQSTGWLAFSPSNGGGGALSLP